MPQVRGVLKIKRFETALVSVEPLLQAYRPCSLLHNTDLRKKDGPTTWQCTSEYHCCKTPTAAVRRPDRTQPHDTQSVSLTWQHTVHRDAKTCRCSRRQHARTLADLVPSGPVTIGNWVSRYERATVTNLSSSLPLFHFQSQAELLYLPATIKNRKRRK